MNEEWITTVVYSLPGAFINIYGRVCAAFVRRAISFYASLPPYSRGKDSLQPAMYRMNDLTLGKQI